MSAQYESDGGTVFAVANNNNAVVVPLAPTRPVGSVLLIPIFSKLITAALSSAPFGFNELGVWASGTAGGGKIWLYAKEVVGGETNPSIAVTGATGTSGELWGACCYCYSSVDLNGGITAILDGTPAITDASGTTICTYPALTTAAVDSLIVRLLARFRDAADTFTPTATWTEREDIGSTVRTGAQHHLQDKVAVGTGVQAAVTVAPSNTTAARYLALSIALKTPQPKQTTSGEVSLASPPVPETRTAHKIIVRACKRSSSHSGVIRAQLFEGATPRSSVLQTPELSTAFADYALSISDADAAAITNYANLSVRWYGYAGTGTATIFDISKIRLEAPEGAAGPQTRYGATSMAVTFDKAVTGRRKTFGQIDRPFIFAASTAGIVTVPAVTHYGATSMVVAFVKDVRGQRKTFGQIAQSVIFSKDVQGQRKTFGQIARPLTFGAVISGRRQAFGQLVRPFIFGAVTSGQRKVFGQITFPIIFTKEAVGVRNVFGQLSMQTLFGKETAAQRRTFGQIAQPVIFGAITAARRKTFSQVALPLTFSKEVQGRLKALGQISLPIVFSKEVQGQRKTFGQLLSPFLFSKDVRGQRKTFGQVSMPIAAAISTAGIRMGLRLYGSLSLPMTFSKDVRGQRKAFGQIAMPLTFAKNVVGQRKTFGQTVFPIIFTKEAVGRKNVFGQLVMQTLFSKETAGRRRTFSQLALPVTFSKAVSGRRKTFGQVALPINTTIVISGKVIHNLFGSIAMPLTFNKQVAARRQTFGQITAPLLFGSAAQAQRRTFGQVARPVIFTATVKSGPVGVHGVLDLDLILTADTKGNIRVFGVILNQADSIYLGAVPAVAVYVGTELVWEEVFNPLDLTGLAVWFDASQLELADGATVNSWENLGAGADAANFNVVPYRPTLRMNALNSHPVVRFIPGSGLRVTGHGVTKDYTLAYVGRMVTTTGGRVICAAYPGGGNLLFGYWTSYMDIGYATGGGGFFTPDTRKAITTAWKLYSADCATPVVAPRLFSNGVLMGTHPTPPAADGWGGTLNLNGYGVASGEETGDCEIAEVVLYNRKLPDVERQEVEAYLREKWGI